MDGAETDGALGRAAVETRDEPVRNVVVHPLPLRLHRPKTEGNNTAKYNNGVFTLEKIEAETEGIWFYDNIWKSLHGTWMETNENSHWFCTHFIGIDACLGVGQCTIVCFVKIYACLMQCKYIIYFDY